MARFRFVSIDAQQQAEILKELDQNSELGRDFLVLVLLSCVVATFGLVQNSAAVIIGAMLIAPLMSPIIAFALALVSGDPRRAGRALSTLLIGATIAVALSAVLGRLVSVVGTVDFSTEGLPSEILSRTQPSLFDLAVALAGGTAAAYALVRPHLSATLAGVAIATALMPPLCVVGLGVSQGNFAIWGGALLLFLTNFVAIVVAGSGIFALAGFLPATTAKRRWRRPHARLVNLLLLLPVVILLTVFTLNIAQQAQTTAAIRDTLTRELQPYRSTSLVGVNRTADGDTVQIVATIRSPATLKLAAVIRIQEALAARLRQPVALKLLVVPLTSLNPLNPPTFTATPTPSRMPSQARIPTRIAGATSTRGVVVPGAGTPSRTPVVRIGTPMASPRPVVRATATTPRAVQPSSTVIPIASRRPSATPTRRATATPQPSAIMPRPTITATWTPEPSPTSTPRPSSTRTALPTATPAAYAVVGGTGGLGVFARRSPGLTAIVAAVPDRTLVQQTGMQDRRDGYHWVQVVLPDGRVVWIPGAYLVPYHAFTRPPR